MKGGKSVKATARDGGGPRRSSPQQGLRRSAGDREAVKEGGGLRQEVGVPMV